MARITEPQLKSALNEGSLARVYLLYGEEKFLTKTYENKIVKLALGGGDADMNYVRYNKAPSAETLSDCAESMPFFAQYKCIVLSDPDVDKLEPSEFSRYLTIISELPETTVVVISLTGIDIEPKKVKAKMKKLIATVEEQGTVCEFAYMPVEQITGMLIAKAARSGCNLSEENAVLLAEMCGRDLTLLSNEVQKLCDYTGSGDITRETIDSLVPKPIDSSVYSLAGELFAGRTDRAFGILSDLFEQRVEPIMIMAALSGHFVDCYRLKLAQAAKKTINNAMTIYGYPKYRYYGLNQLFGSVRGLSVRYLKECIDILYRTNMLLNSSKADSRILLEQAITEISVLKRN